MKSALVTLGQRLDCQLYRKQRGVRRHALLTQRGEQFFPHARAFLERAREMLEPFADADSVQEIFVAASQYLTYYVLIDVVKRFHRASPRMRVRLSTRTEEEIETALLKDARVNLGVAAPYEPHAELEYEHLFSMPWSVITPHRHPFLRRKRLGLRDLTTEPLILFERGSTGRQHVMEAFYDKGLSPPIEMEATNTQIIVRMVEAGLGVSIVPLLPSGAVTRGHRIGVRAFGRQIRPIQSGVLLRKGRRRARP